MGTLYIVATPIGNLADITLRALETLRSVSLILAEDTRTSSRLLSHYKIATKTVSCHEHNERSIAAGIVAHLQQGEDVALISDAGTPLLSDPGYRLVAACIDAGVTISPLPGASSMVAALSASGLPPLPFTVLGFMPRLGSARAVRIGEVVNASHTVVVLESARRVAATLQAVADGGGAALQVVIAREMTKIYEEFIRGSVADLLLQLGDTVLRGEVVLLFAPRRDGAADSVDDATLISALNDPLLHDLSASKRAKAVAEQWGVSKQRVYHLIHGRDDALC
ncbi:MAG: 16S rRNA (cytidine(1402)-2'-O)-methyltransferase [Mariprofundales bacterium]|nr:16S rRNA (cytidine(1402)-2'-O)-methyltransferase [Mariprofundales bacterium]